MVRHRPTTPVGDTTGSLGWTPVVVPASGRGAVATGPRARCRQGRGSPRVPVGLRPARPGSRPRSTARSTRHRAAPRASSGRPSLPGPEHRHSVDDLGEESTASTCSPTCCGGRVTTSRDSSVSARSEGGAPATTVIPVQRTPRTRWSSARRSRKSAFIRPPPAPVGIPALRISRRLSGVSSDLSAPVPIGLAGLYLCCWPLDRASYEQGGAAWLPGSLNHSGRRAYGDDPNGSNYSARAAAT